MNLSLAKSLSNLTVGTHVTVNTVMPGSTLTEGVEKCWKICTLIQTFPKRIGKRFHEKSSFSFTNQRLIRPEEIGRFVTFVASPDSSSFSGEALRIDGGLVPTIF